MSANGKPGTRKRRRSRGRRSRSRDLWRPARPLPEIERVAVAAEPGAMLRSLGDPPLAEGTAAGHYFDAVVERAAAVARALALSADLLAEEPDDR